MICFFFQRQTQRACEISQNHLCVIHQKHNTVQLYGNWFSKIAEELWKFDDSNSIVMRWLLVCLQFRSNWLALFWYKSHWHKHIWLVCLTVAVHRSYVRWCASGNTMSTASCIWMTSEFIIRESNRKILSWAWFFFHSIPLVSALILILITHTKSTQFSRETFFLNDK